ncbi:MAG: glutamate-5-semialdehyde dehydrogenase, partial [Clostridiales Family XIII bacterium]|nr:glutamate-5-semialdehyde dehydrogenase [Clostridiales Family XIII bacterium]
ERNLTTEIVLKKISTPIGVIGVIFESRPDALVQISTLMIKSGNICILKGGSEASRTNKILFDLIYDCGIKTGFPENFMIRAESREDINEILKLNEYIDLLIPRGSNEFVKFIMKNSDIPVMGHADGICHIYVSEKANFAKTIDVIIDAKTQYPATCNAVETILVSEKIAKDFLPELSFALIRKNVEIFSVGAVHKIIGGVKVNESQYKMEYLDLKITIGIVENLNSAIRHINYYGSHHTDAIMTEDKNEAKKFQTSIDSASIFHNISTRFSDGFRYGFGAEVGISTGKIHSRGPVGLDGLTIYKYILDGNYNKVANYHKN